MKLLQDNKKLIFIIILVFIVGGLTGVVAYSVYANTVLYDNTQSGLQATNVNDAIDELYTKTNTWINPSYIELDKIASTNTTKKIFATSKGVCIIRMGKISCFEVYNFSVEKDHMPQVFSDISCNVSSSYVRCNASDFDCDVSTTSGVGCKDKSDDSYCNVRIGGAMACSS